MTAVSPPPADDQAARAHEFAINIAQGMTDPRQVLCPNAVEGHPWFLVDSAEPIPCPWCQAALTDELAMAAINAEADAVRDLEAELVVARSEMDSARVASQQITEWRKAEIAERTRLRARNEVLSGLLRGMARRASRLRRQTNALIRDVRAVRALHGEIRVDDEGYRGCVHCGGDYPCDTLTALDGPTEAPTMRYELGCVVCATSPYFRLEPFESNDARQAWADAHQAATGHEEFRYRNTPVSVGPAEAAEPARPDADGRYDLDDVLTEAGITVPTPGYPRIAAAINAACEAADIDLTVVHDGRVLDYVPGVVWLATVLDKAGLIDWSAFQDEAAGTVNTTPAGEWEQAMRALLGKHVEVVLQREPRKTCVGVLHEFDYHGQVRLGQDDGTWTWCWPALGIGIVPVESAPAPVEAALIGTYADPEFVAHQDHKHPVADCGYCPSEEDR